MQRNNNKVKLTGVLRNGLIFSHEVKGEKFYEGHLAAKRKSGVIDDVLVLIPDVLININIKEKLLVDGDLRSYNTGNIEGNQPKTQLHVLVNNIYNIEETEIDINEVELTGRICKTPIYRKTLSGCEITEIVLAIDKGYGKTDYIPCISWGRNAKIAAKYPINTEVSAIGRIQSREYIKHVGDIDVIKTTREVSLSSIQLV